MMKSRYNIKIETVVDGIRNKSEQAGVEVIFNNVYDEDHPSHRDAIFVQNVLTERFGVVCINLEDHEPGKVFFMTFDPKMYQYGEAEGFTRSESFSAFGSKILSKVNLDDFLHFIFNEKTY